MGCSGSSSESAVSAPSSQEPQAVAANRGSRIGPIDLNDKDVVPRDHPMWTHICEALRVTDPQNLGIGRDVKQNDEPYNVLTPVCAWKIRNPRHELLYDTAQKLVVDDLEAVQHFLGKIKVKTKFDALSKNFGQDDEDYEVNDRFLLHGTKPAILRTILRNGLSEKFSDGLLGKGTYLTEDPSKMDQYCTSDPGPGEVAQSVDGLPGLHEELYTSKGLKHPGAVFYCFIVRASLGIPVYTKDGEKNMYPPENPIFASAEKRELSAIPGSDPPVPYHTLIAEAGPAGKGHVLTRHREFVIFNANRILCEYLVAYKRELDPNGPQNNKKQRADGVPTEIEREKKAHDSPSNAEGIPDSVTLDESSGFALLAFTDDWIHPKFLAHGSRDQSDKLRVGDVAQNRRGMMKFSDDVPEGSSVGRSIEYQGQGDCNGQWCGFETEHFDGYKWIRWSCWIKFLHKAPVEGDAFFRLHGQEDKSWPQKCLANKWTLISFVAKVTGGDNSMLVWQFRLGRHHEGEWFPNGPRPEGLTLRFTELKVEAFASESPPQNFAIEHKLSKQPWPKLCASLPWLAFTDDGIHPMFLPQNFPWQNRRGTMKFSDDVPQGSSVGRSIEYHGEGDGNGQWCGFQAEHFEGYKWVRLSCWVKFLFNVPSTPGCIRLHGQEDHTWHQHCTAGEWTQISSIAEVNGGEGSSFVWVTSAGGDPVTFRFTQLELEPFEDRPPSKVADNSNAK